VENVPTMVKHGLLCRKLVEKQKINHKSIASEEIVKKRKLKRTPDGKTLDEFDKSAFFGHGVYFSDGRTPYIKFPYKRPLEVSFQT